MNVVPNRQNRAVMYLRVGSAHSEDQKILDLQRQGCRQIAAKHGLQIIREYADIGRPAVLERQTALLQLLENLARQHDAAYVVTWHYSRVGKTMDQIDDVERRLRDVESSIVTLTGVETVKRFTTLLADTDEH
ncbi:recombinase family protein [Amycolatopsis sp., V23-08]|uniref:Recombinase family protein n=1 Tax=Amycolatopsis heterodermiae TaxID=3110235 RepID=A0ABU5RLL3_9PSEU|nr:recombinase family protein [Amycolatopsis sp., V23-08]MEA5366444.1 recombinase family protein [Amycolatopsis sp., V23-08]